MDSAGGELDEGASYHSPTDDGFIMQVKGRGFYQIYRDPAASSPPGRALIRALEPRIASCLATPTLDLH